MTDYQRMLEVDTIASKSIDRSTKIGAVLISTDGIVFEAFNGFPFGVHDKEERHARPEKYYYFEHAERNAIYLAAFSGAATRGATLYTTGIPCADCARAVIQAGITKVVVWAKGSGLETTDRWATSVRVGGEMLREAGVEIVEVQRGEG